jgi:hypothetical protein
MPTVIFERLLTAALSTEGLIVAAEIREEPAREAGSALYSESNWPTSIMTLPTCWEKCVAQGPSEEPSGPVSPSGRKPCLRFKVGRGKRE